jgi:predicted PurR-regulated permease PerM
MNFLKKNLLFGQAKYFDIRHISAINNHLIVKIESFYQMETQDRLIQLTTRLVLATLIIIVMVVGQSFLVPFTWSLLIAFSSLKLIEWVQEKTKMSLALIIFVYLIFILLVLFSIGYFFYFELHKIFADLPTLLQKISDRLHALSVSAGSMGIPIPDHLDKSYINDWVNEHKDIIFNIVSAFGLEFWNIILIMFYLFFLLYYKDLVPQFFTAHIQDKRQLVVVRERIQKSLILTRSYIYGMMVLTLISAAMNFVVFLIFGLKFALFFAVFLAILNLIPFIGNPIGLAVIMLFSIITMDNMFIPLMIFISLFAANFIQDNVVRPLIIGDKLQMNAFTVFVAIIIGGMIWGVSGMILFIPLIGILKIFLEGHERHRNYAIFFSEIPKKPKQKRTRVSKKSV